MMTAKRVPLDQIIPYIAFLKSHESQIVRLMSLKDEGVLEVGDVESRVINPVLQMQEKVLEMV